MVWCVYCEDGTNRKPCDVTDSYALSLALIVFKTPKTNFPVQIFELIFVLYSKNMYKFQFLAKKLYVKFDFIGTLRDDRNETFRRYFPTVLPHGCSFPCIPVASGDRPS